MDIIFFVIVIFAVMSLIVISVGLGISFLLIKLFSGVDPGTGLIAGAIFSIGIIYLCIRFISAVSEANRDMVPDDYEIATVTRSLWKNARKKSAKRKQTR